MKALTRTLRPARMALIAAVAGMLPLAAQAQTPSMSEMQARYQEDLQRCATLTDPESKRTCQREAGAALQEARRDRLVTNNANTAANASARCERLPGAQRADCERLMSDSSAVQQGSISGGGVLRELTITVPADTAAPASTYGAQPAPAPDYGAQPAPAPASGYGTQPAPAPSNYGQPAPAPAPSTYGQPAPAPNTYGQPAPAPGAYGTAPAR